MFCFLLLTCAAGNLITETKAYTGTSSDSQDAIEELVDETLNRAFELRVSGKLEEAAAEWERAFVLDPEYMQQRGAYSEDWVHLFLKLGLREKALEIFETGYHGVTPSTPESLTLDERVAWGERLIFGQPGGSKIQGAIGKAQCSLCHEFVKVNSDKRLRAPILSGISSRTKKLLATQEYQQRGQTVQPYAFEGSGIATTVIEYLAESKACPSCYVVPGFGVKGSDDLESPEPHMHMAPISLSVDEMILVDTWILKQEGIKLPSVQSMRAAYHKFIQRPRDRSISLQSIFLAHLFDLNGDEEQALQLLEENYQGILRHEEEKSVFRERRLPRWRENAEMFPHLRKRPEVVKRFPKLFQPAEAWRATDVLVDKLEVEYVSWPHHGNGQYPRWFPDGKRVLYTVCVPESTCDIWSMETHTRWRERVLSDAAFGDPSPDGTQLVFIRGQKIFLHDLKTHQSTMLTDGLPSAFTPPVWNQAGDGIEVMTAKSASSPCQTSTFTLITKSWASRPVNPWKQTRAWQGLPENSTAHFAGFEDFWGKCQVNLPSHLESSTTGWQRWFDGKRSGSSSLARYLVTPRSNFRGQWFPLWWVGKNETGALVLEHPGVLPVFSPNGRELAYEYLRKRDDGPYRLGIVLAGFKKRAGPLPKYVLELGQTNGLEPGMHLLVYYGKTLDSLEETVSFEEDMAIGGVRVLEVNDRQAVVQQSIFKRGIYREGKSPRDNLVLSGDLAITPDFNEWAPLKPYK